MSEIYKIIDKKKLGKILLKNERISYQNYHFTIEASDKKRIKKLKVRID